MTNLPEEVAENLSILIFDTMGIFWTMKHPNQREETLLSGWKLKPEKLENIDVYIPEGHFKEYKKRGILADYSLSIKTSELDAGDWADVFGVDLMEPIGVAIEKGLSSLEESKKSFGILDIINEINSDKSIEKNVKDAAINRFLAAETWGLFSKKGTEIKDLVRGGRVSVVDISAYSHMAGSWGIKNLVVGLISKKLLNERIIARKIEELKEIEAGTSFFGFEKSIEEKDKMPLVWILIDEAHEFLPREGTTLASGALRRILKEGRQPGISLVLATQQPGKIDTDVMTQSDIVISHRLTSSTDLQALNGIMQSYLATDLQKNLDSLPRVSGSAIILDDTNEKIIQAQIRPRTSWHGGSNPSAIPGAIMKSLIDAIKEKTTTS